MNNMKHIVCYTTLFSCLFFSLGYNISQNAKIIKLQDEKAAYEIFVEYLYFKIETLKKNGFSVSN